MKTRIETLDWDSRFFHRNIARFPSDRLSETSIRDVIKQCRQKHVECLYFLSSAGSAETFRVVQRYGFKLVDIRLTFQSALFSNPPGRFVSLPSGLRFRSANSKDVGALKRAAGTAYQESRFFQDPHFSRRAVAGMFSEWIVKSIRGEFDDFVLVALWRGKLAGYITGRCEKKNQGRIGLVWVAPRGRGRHIGAALLQEANQRFRLQGIRTVQVSTQASNRAAQHLYARSGFQLQKVELWYHKWF